MEVNSSTTVASFKVQILNPLHAYKYIENRFFSIPFRSRVMDDFRNVPYMGLGM